MILTRNLKVVLLETLNLLFHGQPILGVFDHQPPHKENQPAPFGNGLIMMYPE